ncbi:MAG: crossover junction endodeoxyribonuclease RuvC [Alphaproteobacteria bacterium CG11_big_fil_rev_8_21_14_0_20_44_7]|nr:MAG: crossover junction endodeoxyribonuclease RuvC [Alphaproteobacteria bacterium CG11_big_fil_rev_8_21_14_0_20_44_7]
MINAHRSKVILGIDPGLRKTGWGIIESVNNNLKFVACGTIKTSDKKSLCERLGELSQGLQAVIKEYDPDIAAIEETFVNMNGQSTLKLGQARGALIVTMVNVGLEVFEYSARLVKKSVVGSGRAEKHQIEMMVKTLLPKANPDSEDAADALAVAITHSNHSN